MKVGDTVIARFGLLQLLKKLNENNNEQDEPPTPYKHVYTRDEIDEVRDYYKEENDRYYDWWLAPGGGQEQETERKEYEKRSDAGETKEGEFEKLQEKHEKWNKKWKGPGGGKVRGIAKRERERRGQREWKEKNEKEKKEKTDLVTNPNPEGRKEKVTLDHAKQWLRNTGQSVKNLLKGDLQQLAVGQSLVATADNPTVKVKVTWYDKEHGKGEGVGPNDEKVLLQFKHIEADDVHKVLDEKEIVTCDLVPNKLTGGWTAHHILRKQKDVSPTAKEFSPQKFD
jgi:hypothetical protein